MDVLSTISTITTFLAPGLGAFARLVPSIINLFHEKQDNTHELAMLDKQIELAKVNAAAKQQEIVAQGQDARLTLDAQTQSDLDTSELRGMIDVLKQQGQFTGIKWVDAVNQTLRPFITYWWCVILYTGYKAVTIASAVQTHTPLKDIGPLLCTKFDETVIGTLIGFWFVDRAMKKLGR